MNNRIIFLDTETTGIEHTEGHRIIEIACVDMVSRKFTDNNFQTYINPQREIDKEAIEVHGIDNSMLEDKPKFENIIEQLFDYVRDAEVIAHNASFDIGFLNAEIKRANDLLNTSYPQFDHVCGKVTDSLAVAAQRYPGMRNSLDALCTRLEIDRSERTFHGALLDANLLAQVWLKLTGGQKEINLQAGTRGSNEATAKRASNKPITIIKANTQELQRHEAYMENLRQKAEAAQKKR